MLGDSNLLQMLYSLSGLLGQIGSVLFAIGAWKFHLITRRRGYITIIVGLGISLVIHMFWWGTSMLFGILPGLMDVVIPLYENTALMNTIGVIDVAAHATVYLVLSWEFFVSWRQHQPPAESA